MGGVEGVFLQQGITGAIIVVLAGVVVFLYKEVRTRDGAIAALQDRLLDRADKHAQTEAELAEKVIETVGTLNGLFSKNRGN